MGIVYKNLKKSRKIAWQKKSGKNGCPYDTTVELRTWKIRLWRNFHGTLSKILKLSKVFVMHLETNHYTKPCTICGNISYSFLLVNSFKHYTKLIHSNIFMWSFPVPYHSNSCLHRDSQKARYHHSDFPPTRYTLSIFCIPVSFLHRYESEEFLGIVCVDKYKFWKE